MLKRDAAAFPILTNIAIALVEAIANVEGVVVTQEVTDVLKEWMATPHARSHAAVLEIVERYNAEGVPQ